MSQRSRAILRAVGGVQTATSALTVPSFFIGLSDGTWVAFLEGGLLMLAVGLGMMLLGAGAKSELRLRDGFLVTALAWFCTSFTAACPLILGPPHLSVTDAVFEAVSGLTTTGSTVIVGLEQLPKSVLFYRQFMQFFGGMGIVVLAVAILPTLRIGATQLTKGETTGPVKDTKLTPRIAETAKALWIIYVGLTLACCLCYWLAGMTFFDAIDHAFSTASTGGFSTHDDSFKRFDSPLIELVSVVFMLLGSISFALHFVAWRRGSLAAYMRDAEFRSFLMLWLGSVALVTVSLWLYGHYDSPERSLREALFQVTSNMSTTGFSNDNFAEWPAFLPPFMILLAILGSCAGSTSGGLKVIRVLIVAKLSAREVMRVIHPRGEFVVKLDRRAIPDSVLEAVAGFVAVFFFCFVAMGLLMMASGEDLVTSFAAIASSMSNLGPSLGNGAVTMQPFNDFATWICTFAMIVGRLEVFTVLVLLTPAFWRE
ncbi:MAG: TrkH family potassium uptake protein [Xanthomonadales bacterium]|nr:TrkH family potassium uptake protein [Xanthomonadales bacterium]